MSTLMRVRAESPGRSPLPQGLKNAGWGRQRAGLKNAGGCCGFSGCIADERKFGETSGR